MVFPNTETATANITRATDTPIHACTRRSIKFQQSHVPDRQVKRRTIQMDRRCMGGS